MILQKSKIYESNVFTDENLNYKDFRKTYLENNKNKYWYDYGLLEACKKDYRSLVKFFISKGILYNHIIHCVKKAIDYENEYIAFSLGLPEESVNKDWFWDAAHVTPKSFDITLQFFKDYGQDTLTITRKFRENNKAIMQYILAKRKN